MTDIYLHIFCAHGRFSLDRVCQVGPGLGLVFGMAAGVSSTIVAFPIESVSLNPAAARLSMHDWDLPTYLMRAWPII